MLPILAAAAVAAFHPPAGPVGYRTTHIRPGPRGPIHISTDKTLRFVPHGAGWLATLVVTAIATDAPPAADATIRAGLEPFRGVPVTVEVDRAGRVGAVMDGAATWAKVVASYDAVAASLETRGMPPGALAERQAILAQAGAIDRAAQDARLREPVADLIGPPPGATEVAGSADRVTYLLAANDGADVRTTVTVSRASGLVLERRVERRIATPGGVVAVEERTDQLP